MLRIFRNFSQSPFGPIIMGVVAIAFGMLGGGGARDALRGRFENAVVIAGSHEVTAPEFKKMFDGKATDYEKQTSQPFPLEEAVREGVDKTMLQELASQAAYQELLTRAGIAPTADVVASELKHQAQASPNSALAQLFDPMTGKFNPAMLQQLLDRNGMTMDEFQREIADDIASQQFGSAVSGGAEAPRAYAALQAALLLESRDITYFVIPAASVPPPTPPTDAQLQALIQQYRDRLMLPERRILTVVRFSAKAIAPTITVDPAQVQQQFQAKAASYARPETRSLIEIPLNDPSKAAEVAAALTKGDDPNAVAKTAGSEAIVYTDQPQSGVADVKAGAAAFAMPVGKVSGPVQGDFKTVILEVTKITPGQAADLNAAKAQITTDLQQSAAADKAIEQSQNYDDAREGGASVAAAAAKVGLQAVTVGPVSSDGKDLTGGPPNPILSQKLLKTAFALPQGGDSDVTLDAGCDQPPAQPGAAPPPQTPCKGEYFDVQVVKVIPPAPPGLDEKGVRPFLTQAYMQQTVIAALQKKAAAAQDALKSQTFDAVAASFGAHVVHQVGLQRINAQQFQQTMGQELLGAIFGTKPGQVFTVGSDAMKGMVVARVEAIRPGDPKQIATLIGVVRQRSDQAYVQGLADAVRQAAMKEIKPTIDLDLARSTMGVDAAMLARATAPAAANSARKLAQ
ncbi:MAG TPA: peptidylprolyl isomerase [Caulobacteraceae bacterium]|jgi:peptidyl-prolyl cis-trans isomerase D